jgi:hypothetical protein
MSLGIAGLHFEDLGLFNWVVIVVFTGVKTWSYSLEVSEIITLFQMNYIISIEQKPKK